MPVVVRLCKSASHARSEFMRVISRVASEELFARGRLVTFTHPPLERHSRPADRSRNRNDECAKMCRRRISKRLAYYL